MNILFTAKTPNNGSEKHCILSIETPVDTTSSSVDMSCIQCAAKIYKIIEATVKKSVPTATVVIKAFFTRSYCWAP